MDLIDFLLQGVAIVIGLMIVLFIFICIIDTSKQVDTINKDIKLIKSHLNITNIVEPVKK